MHSLVLPISERSQFMEDMDRKDFLVAFNVPIHFFRDFISSLSGEERKEIRNVSPRKRIDFCVPLFVGAEDKRPDLCQLLESCSPALSEAQVQVRAAKLGLPRQPLDLLLILLQVHPNSMRRSSIDAVSSLLKKKNFPIVTPSSETVVDLLHHERRQIDPSSHLKRCRNRIRT